MPEEKLSKPLYELLQAYCLQQEKNYEAALDSVIKYLARTEIFSGSISSIHHRG